MILVQNYIIINGKPSWEIPGLVICTLPPLTKPPKKVETLSVPGANGDIVTSLGGYDAYERKYSVAVSRSAGDMEAVVQYLDQSGEIVYSNEPDKIYTMRQTARIDFAALTRYRQAEITQTVQPIKRSVLAPLSISIPAGQLGVPYGIQNSGNTSARPTYTIVMQTNSCKLTLRRPGGDAIDILIDPGITYQELHIVLDATTGNASGVLDTGDPSTSRSGYLTDLVTVSTGDITDLYITPDAIPTTLEVATDSQAIPYSVRVADYIAYL